MQGMNSSLNFGVAEIMAKKENYYVTIQGKKYDRGLIELAQECISGKRDGRISINDAKRLLKAVKDNNSYTDIEKDTIEYIRENYKFTEKSDQWFRTEIRRWAAKKTQEPKKKGTSESILIDDTQAPDANFPSGWEEDKNESVYGSSTKNYTNYIPTPSAKPHLKKDKTVPILIFLAGLLILTGLIYFFWSLFSVENSEKAAKIKTKPTTVNAKEPTKIKTKSAVVKTTEEPTSSWKRKEVSTEPGKESVKDRVAILKSKEKKKDESEVIKAPVFKTERKDEPETAKTITSKVEKKAEPSFSWFGKDEDAPSSNLRFREIESKVIRFEKNNIQVHKESRPGLNKLSRWMKADSSIRVKIIGHTSLEGTEEANRKVSLLRAEMVRDYIAGNGISKDRFEIIPKGASVPIGDNSKEEGKEMNRRVELRIRN
ncbi:OmpA family protein [Leptospira alstonii]|uniref:OmpA family protein n=1 Tax=Leptospira alstonii TaxID=28452 RepID=UPI000774D84B|nr:OmpA family protein [Leptospira alstonii]